MTVLLREALGERLRRARTTQRRTLREVSREARVSLGYLSEVERGRKEASSELLASICDALELPLDELLRRVAGDIGPGFIPQVPDTVPDELIGSLPDPGASEAGRIVIAAAGERVDPRGTPGSAAPTGPRAMAGVAA